MLAIIIMFKIIKDLFKKKHPTIETILLYPEGKRYYRESHTIRKNQIDEDVQKILHRLNKFGHKSFLVGGCIRDLLLDRRPKDFDIVTSATPNQIKKIFNNCRIVGRRFRIAHIIFRNKVIEVSTFRSLPEHRLAKPNVAKQDYLLTKDNNYGTPKEDAARRDFTINSLYFDIRNESIIDFVGGFEDIQAKALRVIGDPDISFQEDPVRMLRAVKFSVLHGLSINKSTRKSIKYNRNEILKASNSRMIEEYYKIFRTWKSAEILKGLATNFLLDVLLKDALEHIKKQNRWEENFFETTIGQRFVIADRMLKEREELTPITFFAILFSDIVAHAIKDIGKEKHLVQTIKNTLEPACDAIGLSRKDRERLVKIYASQSRFEVATEENKAQIEIFRTKDFFYDAFLFFKINALAENNEEAVQSAFFWEIKATPPKNNSQYHRKNPNYRGNKNKQTFSRQNSKKKYKKDASSGNSKTQDESGKISIEESGSAKNSDNETAKRKSEQFRKKERRQKNSKVKKDESIAITAMEPSAQPES